MAVEENKVIVRRFVEEVWNNHRYDLIDEYVDSRFVNHGTMPDQAVGRAGVRPAVESLLGAFPDLRYTITNMVAENDMVTYRWTGEGTHAGSFFGLTATGRQVHFEGIVMARLSDGKIIEQWRQVNVFDVMQHIGAIPGR